MNEHPRIYVVLPVHNRINVSRRFFNCLIAQSYKFYTLVLVDDGCTDGTPQLACEYFPNAIVLNGNGNLWWSGSLNKAYNYLSAQSIAENDIVFITNDDTKISPDFFSKLIQDPLLTAENLVVAPGKNMHDEFIEYGFRVCWQDFTINQVSVDETPNALTTRGLYMTYSTYKKVGGMPHYLLPHYLSDLEYTIRAAKKGFSLRVSSVTTLYVDRSTTGIHDSNATDIWTFFHEHFISKRSAFNVYHWMMFALLSAPMYRKLPCSWICLKRFIKKAVIFLRP